MFWRFPKCRVCLSGKTPKSAISLIPLTPSAGTAASVDLRDFAPWHALPEDREKTGYAAFPTRRRRLMAAVVREGFERV